MRFRSPAGSRRWASYLVTAVLFAALCGAATYWALQLFAPRVAIAPAGSLVDWQKAPDLDTASRLFGAAPSAGDAGPSAAVPSNIRVLGVAASSSRATAVLSIDGKPPIAFLAGAKISDHARLLEVHADSVVIEQGGGRVELPAPKRPDIAVLSAGANRADTPSMVSPVGVSSPAPSPGGFAPRTPARSTSAVGQPAPALAPAPSAAPGSANTAAEEPAPPSEPGAAAGHEQRGDPNGASGAEQAEPSVDPDRPAEPAGNERPADSGQPAEAFGIR